LSTPGSASIADLGERRLIADIRAKLPPPPAWLAIGIGDDAAVVEAERGALEVLTTDSLVEGVHFDRRFSTSFDIGWKALAVNLSDIAAMGGRPRAALLSLGLPPALPADDLAALVDGFLALAREQRVVLAGGNITRSPGPLIVDVTVTGAVRPRRVLTRGGARPGDEIYVTGSVGAGLAGLEWLQRAEGREPDDPDIAACVAQYRRPQPRSRIGALLGSNRAASACMDLSDGLADALQQVAEASGVGLVVEAGALPIAPGARRWFDAAGADPVQAALAGGDDYELLIAVPRRRRGRFATVSRQGRGVPLTRIGQATAERDVRVLRNGSAEPLPAGFVHF
jgi:thiamine-monophosphate kinase